MNAIPKRAALTCAGALAAVLHTGPALAQGEILRNELNRADVSGSETLEVIVARLELQPGATVPRHSHHGDEHMIVLEGGEFTAPDGTVVPFEVGTARHFPAGQVHGGATVTGDTPIVLYTIHVVEKGKPLNIPAE